MTCQAGVQGNEWADLVQEATTEVLKLGSAPFAFLFQALLQFVTKMAARSVVPYFSVYKGSLSWEPDSVMQDSILVIFVVKIDERQI